MILKDTDPMPFGLHKGTLMANVEAKYLMFWHNNLLKKKPKDGMQREVYDYIHENKAIIERDAKETLKKL
jgi:hypothetical protein